MGRLTKSKKIARSIAIALASAFMVSAGLGSYLLTTDAHDDTPAATAPFPNDAATKKEHNRQTRKENLERLRSMVDGLKKAAAQPEAPAENPEQSDDVYRRLSRLPLRHLGDPEGDTGRQTDPSDDRLRRPPEHRTVRDGLDRIGDAENRTRIREMLEKHAPNEATISKDSD